MDVKNSAVESEQVATSGNKIDYHQVDIDDIEEDIMSTNFALPLLNAIKEDDFITASRLLQKHWEKLTFWGENSYYFFSPPDVLNYYRKMMSLVEDDRDLNDLFQDPSKNEIWDLSLHISCLRTDLQLAELLLTKGASTRSKFGDNNIPLHEAVWENHPTIVHLLLQTDPSCVNIKGNFGRTALHFAATEGRTEIVDLLLEYGADVTLVDDSASTALHDACWRGHEYMVECILKRSRSAINSRNYGGYTALNVALKEGYTDIVKLLLNSNDIADVYDQHKAHSCKTFTKQEPVDCSKKDNLIKRLIMHREQGDLCVTPLDILACHTCYEKIELLKATAADVNLTDKRQQTALDKEIRCGSKMVQLLLKHGAHCKEIHNGRTWNNIEHGTWKNIGTYISIEIIESLLMYGDYNFTRVPDCVRNVFLIDEVDVELLQYFMKNTEHCLDDCVDAINKLFVENSKLTRLFLCSGIRIKYLNDKYDGIRLTAKIYYFVRWCVAWLENEHVKFVKIEADGEYVMEFRYDIMWSLGFKNSMLKQFNGKSPRELLDDCVKETEVMQSRRLGDTRLTLLDLIEADLNQLVKYLGNNDLLYALEGESNFSEFPICGEILKMHIDRGLKRRLLIEKCVQYFSSAYSGCPTLPPKIVEPIFYSLPNRDLYAFTYACSSLI